MNNRPYTFEEAQAAAAAASRAQKAAEDNLREAVKAAAEAERAYRKALSETIVSLRADGIAATTCADVARGADNVARLRYDRMSHSDAIAVRSCLLGHIATTRDHLDMASAQNGTRPPTTTLEHVARITEALGGLALQARVGADPTSWAVCVAADALGLLEFLTEQERRS